MTKVFMYPQKKRGEICDSGQFAKFQRRLKVHPLNSSDITRY
jgi:hypothetical protein